MISIGNDNYLLSYYVSNNKIEHKIFKYTSYEGYRNIKTYEQSLNSFYKNDNSFISCFLFQDQFPICLYSNKKHDGTIYYLDLIGLNIAINYFNNITNKITINTESDDFIFIKAVYLSKDYGVFCYYPGNNYFECQVKKIVINLSTSFSISIADGFTDNDNSLVCDHNLYKFDLIKVDDDKYLVGCEYNSNQIKVVLNTVK
jgi:hypothetical protein